MKKILSLILAAVISFSIFSISAYGDGPQPPDFSTISGVFYSTDSNNHSYRIYMKNGRFLAEGCELFKGIKINFLYDGDYYYIYPTVFPLFHIKLSTDEYGYPIFNTAEETFIESYEEKIGNTTYYVEKYEFEESVIKYYYSDNEFKFAETTDEYDSYTTTLISTEVDDRILRMPFYSIDLTFILELIYG